jgi:hypothetical protein
VEISLALPIDPRNQGGRERTCDCQADGSVGLGTGRLVVSIKRECQIQIKMSDKYHNTV